MKAVFLRALEASDKEGALRAAIDGPLDRRFEVEVAGFAAVPRSPFAYWVSEPLRRLFTELPPFDEGGRIATVGLQSSDDLRFLRLWWEFGSAPGFAGFAKGGQFSPYYADVYLAVDWADDGREIKAFAATTPGSSHWSRNIRSADQYFRPGLTWPRRTQGGLSFRAMPAGCIFADKGPAAFVDDDDRDALLALLAVVNTRAFRALVDLQMAFGSYEVGVIQRTPMPRLSESDQAILARLARNAWALKRSLDTCVETSHAFTLPAVLQVGGATLAARVAAWTEHVRAADAELARIHAEINDRCFGLYGLNETDQMAIVAGFDAGVDDVEKPHEDVTDEDRAGTNTGAADLAAELVSWAVGVAFGRFDLRLATGARGLPAVPDPFDVLPVRSPGMVVGDDNPPGSQGSGFLVDDPGDRRDLGSAVRAALDTVLGAKAETFWDEASALLDPRGHELRVWLRSGLFEHHLKLHSKSRRKAPVVWQFGTPSGRYSVWLYAHRLTDDSVFQLQNDVLVPKLAYEERQLIGLVESAEGNPSTTERREIADQEALVEELRALLEEMKRVSPLWKPTLRDGVVLAMAPLWRLVPSKPWQRELKAKWDALAAGRYDWAQLAMHLWPERVVPKCANDRSMAIAHRLEDTFWVEQEDGTWVPRRMPRVPVEALVRERTSAATKAALQVLMTAPATASVPRARTSGQAAS